jgi:hypothetical protein
MPASRFSPPAGPSGPPRERKGRGHPLLKHAVPRRALEDARLRQRGRFRGHAIRRARRVREPRRLLLPQEPLPDPWRKVAGRRTAAVSQQLARTAAVSQRLARTAAVSQRLSVGEAADKVAGRPRSALGLWRRARARGSRPVLTGRVCMGRVRSVRDACAWVASGLYGGAWTWREAPRADAPPAPERIRPVAAQRDPRRHAARVQRPRAPRAPCSAAVVNRGSVQ